MKDSPHDKASISKMTAAELKRVIADARKSKDIYLLSELCQRRLSLYSRHHRKLPKWLEHPLSLGLIVLAGYALLYTGPIMVGDMFVETLAFAIGVVTVLLFSHPLGHSLCSKILKIQIDGLFLGGKARIEPTFLVHLPSFCRQSRTRRFAFHISGVVATLVSTSAIVLFAEAFAFNNLFLAVSLVLLLVVAAFETVNSSKHGDIARAIREFRIEAIST